MALVPKRGPKNSSGGPRAPRRSNGNIDWQEVLTDYIQLIIVEQIAPNTNRGFMYINPYFDTDFHKQLLELNPARLVDQMVRGRVKFVGENSRRHSGKAEAI